MAIVKSFRLLRLSIVLFVLIAPNHHLDGQITSEKLNVFNNVQYQCLSNSSIIGQVSVRSSVQCGGQCIQSLTCKTATFDQTNHVCSLFTESSTIGQLIQHNQMVTFERQGTNSAFLPSSTTTTTTTANPLCTGVIPSFGNTWTCINVSSSTFTVGNERLYLKSGVRYSVLSIGNVTAYLESNSNLTFTGAQDIKAYIESGAILSSGTGRNIVVYLESRAFLSVDNYGSVIAYLESGARLSITSGGNIIAYLKLNASITSLSSGYITTYYENGASRSFTTNNGTNQTLCSSVTFDYSNIPSRGC